MKAENFSITTIHSVFDHSIFKGEFSIFPISNNSASSKYLGQEPENLKPDKLQEYMKKILKTYIKNMLDFLLPQDDKAKVFNLILSYILRIYKKI